LPVGGILFKDGKKKQRTFPGIFLAFGIAMTYNGKR
jgi:hypothetical protein